MKQKCTKRSLSEPELKRLHNRFIDTMLIILIAICLIFINGYTINKIHSLEKSLYSALSIDDNVQIVNNPQLIEEIKSLMPETCKMVELYDSNISLVFKTKIIGTDVSPGLTDESAINSDEFISVIKEYEEGQTIVTIDENDQVVYFKWITTVVGDRYLLVVYNSMEKVDGLWVFSFTCHIMLILIFVLLIRIRNTSYYEKIDQYQQIADSLYNEIKR